MKKLLVIGCLLFASKAFGASSCPQSTYPENPKLGSEFSNLCYNIAYPHIVNGTASSMTITGLTVTSIAATSGTITNISVSTFTASSATITNLTATTAKSTAFTVSTATVTGQIVFSPTTKGILGTTTNDSAPTGNVGEYVISTSNQISFPGATGNWGDITSISLTAGDWDVTVQGYTNPNGATVQFEVDVGVGTTSGNVSPGSLAVDWSPTVMMISGDSTGIFFTKRLSLSGTTTVYAKIKSTFTVATPVVLASIYARRVR